MDQPRKAKKERIEKQLQKPRVWDEKEPDGGLYGRVAGLGVSVNIVESLAVDREGITWSVRNAEKVFMHVSSAALA